VGGVGNPEDDETEVAFDLDELKALAMAAIATAATAFPDPGGTGIKGGGTGKCVKAWLLAEVAEDGVRLKDEFRGPKAVTMGLLGAVWDPFVDERSTAPDVVEVGVENRRGKILSPGPADFGDLLWNALFRPDSTKCLFRIGRHSRGKSPGDFGTLASGCEATSASSV